MKRIIFITLILVIISSSVFLFRPQKTEAAASGSVIVVGSDLPRDPQKGIGPVPGLNSVIYIAAKMLLNTLTQSVVNWINSGFEGSPTFVQNPQGYFTDLADQASGAFITQLGMEGILCSPFKLPVLYGLKIKYSYSVPSMKKFQCTLGEAAEEWDDFMNDFVNGGWDRWLSINTNEMNNPYGAYFASVNEIERKRAAAAERGKLEATWGSGFVSLKKCDGGGTQDSFCDKQCGHLKASNNADCFNSCPEEDLSCQAQCDAGYDECYGGCVDVSMSSSELCNVTGGAMKNTTPGKIIADQLTGALNKPAEGLNLVQDINQLLSAVFDALVNQLIGQGLASLTESPPSQPESEISDEIDESSRELLISEIDYSLENERNYESLREESLGIISDGLITASNCVNCYQEQISAISNPNFNPPAGAVIPTLDEINQKIGALNSKLQDAQSTVSTFQSDITASQSLIDQLENLKLEAMMAETNSQLEEIQNEYYETSAGLHSLYVAQIDLDAVQQEYDAIRAEYEQCQTKLEELESYLR